MNLHDHRIRVLEAQIQVHEVMLRQHADAPEQLEAIRLLRVRIVEQLEAKLKANADTPSASSLAAELRVAKAAYAACKNLLQMPAAPQVAAAHKTISIVAATPEMRGKSDHLHALRTLESLEAVLDYKKRKAALANTVAEIQQRIHQATRRSDLE
jgi:hypothetical protein